MKHLRTIILAAVAALLALAMPGCAQDGATMDDMNAVRAPELTPNLGWLNTDKPLEFTGDLKGQVVLLDFWTYCCINCIHILPDLEYLEEKYKDEPVAIIGVHSAKFENEANRETIRAAVQRYQIKHPVVIDDYMAIWNAYTAKGWPTFVLVDSRGRVVAKTSGEGHREELDAAIGKLLEEGRANKTLASAPLKFNPEATLMPTGELAFPGKLLADEKSNRLFIADSNHNRIIVTTLPNADGKSQLVAKVGSGKNGKADGSFETAAFQNPQGMTVRGNVLYVADTDNHLIRAVDFKTSQVRTIAGTGVQSYDRQGGKAGTAQAVSSPWALALDGDRMFIAMAGLHQVWEMNLQTQVVKVFSGSGQENIVDGPADSANFAQPSGLALQGGKLYVADSEVSGIREVDTATGAVRTIVGGGLFVFGDRDGVGDQVRLQHALGIAPWRDSLVIADTYNHKVKQVVPGMRAVKTLAGAGKPATETSDSKAGFFEPGGLSVVGDRAFIADTNNHRVVSLDLVSGAWSEVMIGGLEKPRAEQAPKNLVTVDMVRIDASTATVTLQLEATLPAGAHPSPESPMLIRVKDGDRIVTQQTLKTDKLPVTMELAAADLPATGTLQVRWSFAWCTEGNAAVCVPQRHDWAVPVEKAADGEATINLSGKASPAL